jgi:glycine/D-amino acid oxidase-like deaminating enzyme
VVLFRIQCRSERAHGHIHAGSVAVVGAGVVGLMSAYFLRRAGLNVSVYEAESGPAQLASEYNAGLLCPTHSASFAVPVVLLAGIRSLVADSAFRLRATALLEPSTYGWLARYVVSALSSRAEEKSLLAVRFAQWSVDVWHALLPGLQCVAAGEDASAFDPAGEGLIEFTHSPDELQFEYEHYTDGLGINTVKVSV